MRKITCGIHGVSFVVMSSQYSPIELEKRIIAFIDDFYYQYFNEETFDKYRKGTIARLKSERQGFENEARLFY